RARDDVGKGRTAHLAADHRNPGWGRVPARSADLQVVRRREALEQGPPVRILPRANEADVAGKGRLRRARSIEVGVDALGKESGGGDPGLAPRRDEAGVGEIDLIAGTREFEHARLRLGVEEPEDHAPVTAQRREAIGTESDGVSGAEDDVGVERLEASCHVGGANRSEATVPAEDIEALGAMAESAGCPDQRVLGAMGSHRAEDGQAERGQKLRPASRKSALFLLEIESSLSSKMSPR